MVNRVILSVALVVVVAGIVIGQEDGAPDIGKASWIWTGPAPVAVGEWECYTREVFELSAKPKSAKVLISADNVYELYVNGAYVGEDGGAGAIYWKSLELYDVTRLLVAGENVIAARGKSLGGSAGLLMAVKITAADGEVIEYFTGKDSVVRQTYDEGWDSAKYAGEGWKKAVVIGRVGVGPWGAMSWPGPVSPIASR